MNTIRLYCTDYKGVEIAEKLLDGAYVKAAEVLDKDPQMASGVTEEVLCHCKGFDTPDLIWIGIEIGELGKYICYAKIEG